MTTADPRCPSCSAVVPAGASWCSLCFHDLRPPPAPVLSALPPPTAAAPGSALALADAPAPARGRHRARHARPSDGGSDAVPAGGTSGDAAAAAAGPTPAPVGGRLDDAEVAAMLAELRAAESDPLAGVPAAPDTRLKKALLVGGGVAVIVTLFVVASVFAALFIR